MALKVFTRRFIEGFHGDSQSRKKRKKIAIGAPVALKVFTRRFIEGFHGDSQRRKKKEDRRGRQEAQRGAKKKSKKKREE